MGHKFINSNLCIGSACGCGGTPEHNIESLAAVKTVPCDFMPALNRHDRWDRTRAHHGIPPSQDMVADNGVYLFLLHFTCGHRKRRMQVNEFIQTNDVMGEAPRKGSNDMKD